MLAAAWLLVIVAIGYHHVGSCWKKLELDTVSALPDVKAFFKERRSVNVPI